MNLIFPAGYKTENIGYISQNRSLCLRVQTKEEAQRLVKEELNYLRDLMRALELEEIKVGYQNGDKCFQIRNPPNKFHIRSIQNKMDNLLKYPYLNGSLLGGYDYDIIHKLADEVSSLRLPAFLVSMSLHRNLMVNEAGLEYLDSKPEELFRKSLAKLWVQPTAFKPINYEVHIPPHLQEIHNLLTQQKDLHNHHYYGWKVNGDDSHSEWVRWTSDIKYRSLGVDSNGKEHHCRLMISRGHDVVVY